MNYSFKRTVHLKTNKQTDKQNCHHSLCYKPVLCSVKHKIYFEEYFICFAHIIKVNGFQNNNIGFSCMNLQTFLEI